MKNQLSALFVAYSPRHIILSIAVALNNECKNSVLVIHDSFLGARLIYEVLEKMANSPFTAIYFYSSSNKGLVQFNAREKLLFRFSETKSKLSFHLNIVEKHPLTSIVTPMVNDVLCQFLVNKMGLVCEYIEDGLFSYIDMPAKRLNTFKLLLRKLKYGLWYQPPNKTGSASWVSASWFLNPSLASPSITRKPVKSISNEYLTSPFFNDFITKAYERFQITKWQLSRLDYIIILDVIKDVERRNPKFIYQLNKFIAAKCSEGKSVGLKLHPRDSKPNSFSGVEVLPNGLPAEIIISVLKSGTVLIGDYSSVLIDAKNRDDIIVEVVNNNSHNEQFKKLFKSLEIPIHETFESLLNND